MYVAPTIAPLIVQNLKNNLITDPEFGRCHFCVQNGPFARNNFFLVKAINVNFMYLLALFLVQKFKKILREDPKWTICPKQELF